MARLLVVEDHAATRRAVQWLLERDGHVVDAVETLDAALDRLEHARHDLIITDWMLESETAEPILDRLQMDEAAPPVVVVTAHPERVAQPSRSSVAVTVEKPLDYATLRDVVGYLVRWGRDHRGGHP